MPTSIDTDEVQETLGIFGEAVKNFSLEKLVILVGLIIASYVVIRILVNMVDRTMEHAGMERGIRTFLRSGLRVLLWVIAVCILLGYLGVPMTSLVAVLSVLSLAVSLAVQGILSNLAGGIMIVSTHPFAAGDFVELGDVSGKIKEVGLVYTVLTTSDNKEIHIPNGDISAKTIVNYSANPTRRVEVKFTVSYDAEPQTVKDSIARVVGEHGKILFTPEPLIRVNSYGSSSVEYIVRVWCATEDYWTVYFDLQEQVKAAFDRAGIEMTYDHLNVHLMEK